MNYSKVESNKRYVRHVENQSRYPHPNAELHE